MEKLSSVMKAKQEEWQELLIVVVAESREHNHHYFCSADIVNQSMLLRDASAPAVGTVTLKWFGMPCAAGGMFIKFGYQLQRLVVGFRFAA